MSVGADGATVLVVVGDRSRGRELAAAFEGELDGVTAVTASSLDDAVQRLEATDVDGLFLVPESLETEDGAADAVAVVEETADVPVVVACEDGLSERAAVEAGAAAAVDAPPEDGDVTLAANRLELAVQSAQAERVARESQHRYRRLLETSPAAIVIYDAEGTILYANQVTAEFAGADDVHEVVGRDLFEFVTDDSLDGVRERTRTVLEDREPVPSKEIAIEGLDGERRYLEAASSPVTVDGEPGGQVVLTDVTELKERERRLRTERDRFTTLFQSLPEPAVHVRNVDDRLVVQNVNPAFEEVFGFDGDAVVGESLNDLIVPEERREEARRLDRVGFDEGQVEREVRRLTANGEREFLFRAQTMETAAGPDESVGIYVDITDQKRREAALERQNERLDAFASIVSHDLQSPLSVAKGNLFLAREEDDEEYLENMEGALDRMERIIDDLLRLARRGEQSVDPEPVDESVVATAWTAVDREEGTLRNEWERTVLADRGQLRELLENLLRNAVEHGSASPQQAEDAVKHGSASPRQPDDAESGEDDADETVTIEVGTTDEGFYVADDGPGIPAEERDDVFEPGYTTHDEGTGFGLVVVQEIARAHGWTAAVTESQWGGARFEFGGVQFE